MPDDLHVAAPATASGRLRVAIADDHRLMLTGLRTALMRAPDIELVGEAQTGKGIVAIAVKTKPDVVLLDLRMPDGDGLWALKEIRRETPETKVIVLSMFDDHQHVNQAINDGAAGYIVKTIDPDDLPAAIRQTVQGTVFSARAVVDPRKANQRGPNQLITDRELEILQHVAEGLSNAQIAKALWVTEQTVKFHLSNVYRKLGVSNRTEASRYALSRGLLASGVIDTRFDGSGP
jgi:DNA-binding NarL/FixJ family response regulator